MEARAAGADLFPLLHHDTVQPQYLATWTVDGKPQRYSDAFHGYSVFVSDENAHAADSRRFGALIGEAMLAAGFSPSLHHAEMIPGEGGYQGRSCHRMSCTSIGCFAPIPAIPRYVGFARKRT